jgi:hemoglobin-like flavoprotein
MSLPIDTSPRIVVMEMIVMDVIREKQSKMVDESDLAGVRKSYGRVVAKGKFVDRFYEIFINSTPEIRRMFVNTDFEKQNELLERSLSMALLFPQRNLIARQVIDRIRVSHSRDNMDIDPALYRFWLDSLIKTVAEKDLEFNPELEQQWRRVLQVTLDYIAEGY